MKIYLVGGAVRDKLMGKDRKDCDYVVIGSDEKAFIKAFPGAKKVGTRKPVFIVAGHEYTLSPFDDIETDLDNRDLTINAVAQDLSGKLITHPKALHDIEKTILRPVHEKNFYVDPLRVFRAARFAADLPEFKVHPATHEIMKLVGKTGALEKIAAERVGNEILSICKSLIPGRAISLLAATGTLSPWLKEINSMQAVPAGPDAFHSVTVLEHSMAIMNHLAGSALRVWMGLCHDLGKILSDPDFWPTHHGHEKTGESTAIVLGQRLRLPKKFILAGATAARWHMTAGRYEELRTGTRVNLIRLLNKQGLLIELFELVRADKGFDYIQKAKKDLNTIMAVHLPEKHYDLGPKSGEIFHQLCCQALKGGQK